MLEDLSQHILDIAENGPKAGAGSVSIELDDGEEEVSLTVRDDGKGMDAATLKRVTNPFYTTRKERRVGLGFPFLKQLVELCGGRFSLESEPGVGTTVFASFRKDSIDTPPLGDIPSSLVTLLAGYPSVRWTYVHRHGGSEFRLESDVLVEALGGGSPFEVPAVVVGVREYLEENLRALYVQEEDQQGKYPKEVPS